MKFLQIFYVVLLCVSTIFGKYPKRKLKSQAQASARQSPQQETSQELKNLLNELITYDDGSIISELDLVRNVITITNPYDNSIVLVSVDDIQYISDEITDQLCFEYALRVASWFDDTVISSMIPQETIERHRFAQRVDEIIILYGRPSSFTNNCGQVVENLTLPGTIITQDGRQLNGIFEYAQDANTNSSGKPTLYHRFLHPNSRAVPL